MKTTGIVYCLTVIVLAGCGNSEDSSPLLGSWITEACDQASDSNGTTIDLWLKAIYEFSSLGTIRIGHEDYADSSCVTRSDLVVPSEGQEPVEYEDKGEVLLQEGMDGGSLLIEMGRGEQLLSVEAFYTINDNILCFSDAFTFEALTFGVSQAGTDAIDFENCLLRR